MQILNKLHETTYDSLVDEYDDFALKNKDIVEGAVSKLKRHLDSPARVLDVGCAVGNITSELVEHGYEVTGIDISPKMIARARKCVPKANFIVGDLCSYDFADNKYDAIVAFAFIHLFPKNEAARILEIFRALLKPGGIIYTGTTDSDSFSEGFETKEDFENKLKRFRVRWPRKDLDSFFDENGFEIIKVYEHTDKKGKLWLDYIIKVKEK
ncbi:MAG: hypothetical protein QG623_33 [Patescibacteria group bacterium]|nr:hypothetical protein [Patescibacteria group bacterium]